MVPADQRSDGAADGPESLLVIDAHNLLYRAFHALPSLNAPDGRPVNAIFGFVRMVMAMMEELQPRYVAIAIDLPSAEPSFRSELMPQYKANRPPMPEDLVSQMPLLDEVARALSIPVIGAPGYEADDVLGTLAAMAHRRGVRSYLATGDQDAYQLVRDDVFICGADRSMRGNVLLGAVDVREKLGVDPAQVVDYKALAGDSSDNIKGVAGVGPKRAAQLLEQFGSLDDALARASEIPNPRIRDAVLAAADGFPAARQVLTIVTDLDLGLDLAATERRGPDTERARQVFMDLGFRTLAENLAPPEPAEGDATVVDCRNARALETAVNRLRASGEVALVPEFGTQGLLTLGAADASGHGYAFVLREPSGPTLFDADEGPPDLPEPVRRMLEDGRVQKICYSAKKTMRRLEPVRLGGVRDDAQLAAYLLSHGLGSLDLPGLVGRYTGRPLAPASSAEDHARAASGLHALMGKLREQLAEEGLTRLYEEVELPLASVLASMEGRGIKIDAEALKELGSRLRARVAEAEERVFELAGERFTIGSPKQLQEILFTKLELPHGRKTKTGYSTDADVLDALAEEHEIVRQILEWRQLTKLLSTYVDALLGLADPRTGRVHTRYNQAAVVTGRLSSSDPNLQNIPVRTEWGREVRRCFVAPEDGWVLLSCDYSQIELRILAHFTGDERLVEAFAKGLDVHTHTASLLFDKPISDVTRQMRGIAKTVNFGVIYGMGAVSLARGLGISRAEAAGFIDRYFQRYSGVRRYTEEIVEQARELGYVTTMLGRRRDLPELRSSQPQVRAAGERMAVNTPIQGTAADLVKLAMLRVSDAFAGDAEVGLLLQVHDELVFEVTEGHAPQVAAQARELMAGALHLAVPVMVDAKVGRNWGDMSALG